MSNIDHPLPSHIVKRNGSLEEFDHERIAAAISACYGSLEEVPATPVMQILQSALYVIGHNFPAEAPTVEQVQEVVINALLGAGEFEAAKHYIAYRTEHAVDRVVVPVEVQRAFDMDRQLFPTELQQFMFYDKYSRFNWDKMRRETWGETVYRAVQYLITLSENKLDGEVYLRIYNAILSMEVMPSMRLLAQAGPAAERNGMAIYNCSYLPVDSIDSFVEAMLISMAGCGVGFSVERVHVEKFPRIRRQQADPRTYTYVVEDTTEGWANAVRAGLLGWWNGCDVEYDYSLLRSAGTPLLTKGGRASGPEPLRNTLNYLRTKILSRQGTFLRTIDAHDMMCVVGGNAVSGGVRRTAMISLFDYDDVDMRTCKDGVALERNPHRWNSNNSAVWPADLTQIQLIDQFIEMFRNMRGEPGVFSRINANANKPARRYAAEFGSNPCGEINLRPFQFCNLSIAIARADDSVEDLSRKVEIATIIGTIQSMATNFPGLRDQWQENCEEERLLGVDISGQQDCPVIQDEEVMQMLRELTIITNVTYAQQLDIEHSAAITCNKPNGNSSVLLNCSSGIHPRWAPFYIKNIRISPHSPIFKALRDAGAPMDPENGQVAATATSWVVHFPVKSPEGATCRRDMSAIDQCEYWLLNKLNWTEHNPSVTITYREDELLAVTSWVWEHRHVIGGMAFLPEDDAQYDQMPYQEITEEEYHKLADAFPAIDWARMYAYEHTDMTEAANTLACMSGTCEIELIP